MSKKVNGLHADGVMRDVQFFTEEVAAHHIHGGMSHIDCFFMDRSEESKPFPERNVLSFRVTWERKEYVATLMGVKGDLYWALGRIDPPQDLKVPLWAIEAYMNGEFVDTSELSVRERLRFSRLMSALLQLRDKAESCVEEKLALLTQRQVA